MRTVILTCSVCGTRYQRVRMVGARPKRCPDCRRSKRAVAAERLAELTVPVELPPFVPLGPCQCQGCGAPVWWMRWAMPYHGIKKAWCEPDGEPHRCVDRLAPARAEWDNGPAGTSSQRVDSLTPPSILLVPGVRRRSLSRQGLDA